MKTFLMACARYGLLVGNFPNFLNRVAREPARPRLYYLRPQKLKVRRSDGENNPFLN